MCLDDRQDGNYVFGGEVPGKQLVDPVNKVLGDAGRIIPHHLNALVPLEASQIVWQR
ncbi:MAG TPA: hypothetical protein VFC37_11215 [Terracidiphilus sp.]|nr:hypothetical protein [Terracidiphilus sp.]